MCVRTRSTVISKKVRVHRRLLPRRLPGRHVHGPAGEHRSRRRPGAHRGDPHVPLLLCPGANGNKQVLRPLARMQANAESL